MGAHAIYRFHGRKRRTPGALRHQGGQVLEAARREVATGSTKLVLIHKGRSQRSGDFVNEHIFADVM
jgi:hypothetical protein